MRWICHYYEKEGHICPICFWLHGGLIFQRQRKPSYKHRTVVQLVRNMRYNKFKWRVKRSREPSNAKCQVGHMTGEKSFIMNIQPCSSGHVTFCDGAKGKLIDKGLLNNPGLSKLQDVILIEWLTANLISISQLCDQGLFVSFSKDKCIVTDTDNTAVMTRTHSSNDC